MIASPPQKTTYKDGTVHWRNAAGLLHRTDGPAVEWADGDRAWYLNGKPHRTDGPAVEWADGGRGWWINGIEIELNPTMASFIENGLISLDQYAQDDKFVKVD